MLALHLLRPVPEPVRRRARLHLLDWLGCVAGARGSELARRLCGEHPVVKSAWLGNLLEMDDVHRAAILHPGPVIWPTILRRGDGALDDALAAAVRGYEAMIAIGSMLDARHYAYWHKTSTAGAFGAAAAAASTLAADAAQLTHALGLAGSVAGGLWQTRNEPVMAKQWHVAHAVDCGLAAARHACRGITGPRFILEGPQGLIAATCERARPLELPDGWRLEEVSFKPWGACRHTHPAITAALELRAAGRLQGRITVRTYADALAFCDRPDPRTVAEAKFSLQHALAVVRARGAPRLEDFEPEAIVSLARLRRDVQVEEDGELTAAYPRHFGARVETAGGGITCRDALGDPELPLAEESLIAKAQALMQWSGIAPAEAAAAIRAVLEGTEMQDILATLDRWL
jgi:2-methylcitrate dehydratase PrpD